MSDKTDTLLTGILSAAVEMSGDMAAQAATLRQDALAVASGMMAAKEVVDRLRRRANDLESMGAGLERVARLAEDARPQRRAAETVDSLAETRPIDRDELAAANSEDET